MTTNENDPRPGRAEGRNSSAANRTTTSVPTRTRDEESTQDPGGIAPDALAALLEEWSDVVIYVEGAG